jgi:hypothetical protein
MTDDGRKADVLRRARRAWSPDAADQERVRRAIDAALAAGAPANLPPAAPRNAGWGARLLAVVTIAGVSGGIGYSAGFRAGHRETPPVKNIAAPLPYSPIGPLTDRSPQKVQPSLIPPASMAQHRAGRPAHHEAEASASPPADSLAVEVRALGNAERALRDYNPSLALAFLEDLDRQVPHGRLTEERDAAATLARCARGDRPIGVDLAGEFAERHPKSVYRARIEETCAATDPSGAGHSASGRQDQ